MRRRDSGRRAIASFAVILCVGLAASAPPASAQDAPAASDMDRLRQASVLESAGDLPGAERLVRGVLEENPSSLTALLALERLLTVQGRLADLLPAADALIQTNPRSAVGHQVRLRVVARTGTTSAIESAITAWSRATPNLETPWREGAAVWHERGEPRRAVTLLETGRRSIDREDALALELGDAWLAAGDANRAAGEWARAVGGDGRGFMLVQRRLHELPDGGARIMPMLVDRLAAEPRTPGRLRAATLLAVEARLADAARRHADALVAITRPQDRESLLTELARRSDHAGLHGVALWAYGELLRQAPDPAATLALRTRVAELALLAGDTALAAQAYGELERAATAGSPQRRQAVALRIQLTAREGDLARATTELDAFRAEFPAASEADEVAALIAAGYMDAGDDTSAMRVLTGVQGPRTAQLRGRIRLRAGDIHAARDELLAAAGQLRGAEATETLALAALLMRVTSRGGEVVARLIGADDEERAGIVRAAGELSGPLAATERAAILDFVAGVADRAGLDEDADALRREIFEALPRSHEAAGALLATARRALRDVDRAEEARVLLERLILEYPRSTLAPQARQELQRLRARVTTQ